MAAATFVGVEDDSFAIEADVTVKETHNFTSAITTKPVGGGKLKADHILREQPRLSLQVVISDTPMRILSNLSNGVVAQKKTVAKIERTLRDAEGKKTGVEISYLEGYVMDGQLNRRKSVHAEFRRAWKEGILVNVQTSLELYPNMGFTSVSEMVQAGSQMTCDIELVQLDFQETQTVAALPPAPKKPTTKADKDGGRKPLVNKEIEEATSAARALLNALLGRGEEAAP